MGTAEFDASMIDPASIRLSREGVDGEVAPLRWSYEDVATPFEGELCDCHDLTGDGIMDLVLKVSNQEVFTALQLNEVFGETVKLTITGNLMEEFGGYSDKGEDCMSVLNKRSQIYGKVIDINTLDCEERADIEGLQIPQSSIKVTIDRTATKVTFQVTDAYGRPVIGIETLIASDDRFFRFTMVKLVAGTNGDPDSWYSYIRTKKASQPMTARGTAASW